MFNSLKYSSGSLNYFLSFVTLLFLLCSAVAVCSDVLASLSYVGIVGYIAVGLLAIVFLTWLVLYLSSSKPVSQVDIERTYYKTKIKTLLNSSNQLTQAEIKILDFNIAAWVILNEFRVKLYNRISRYGEIDDKDPHRILSRIFRSNKHNIESEFEKKKIINIVGNYYYKFYKYRELDELTLENRIKINDELMLREDFFSNLFNFHLEYVSEKLQNLMRKSFQVREKYLIGSNTISGIISFIALANVSVNALTLFGSTNGVIGSLAYLFGFKQGFGGVEYISLVFLIAGGLSSFKLTKPMIEHFGRKLELLYQDFSYSCKCFSSKHVISFFLALFSALASATFAVYNTPLITMINNVFGISSAALSTGILLGTFLIAVFSSFSLYFTSIYSKLDDFEKIKGKFSFSQKKFISLSAWFLVAICVDIFYVPPIARGILSLVYVFLCASRNFGYNGCFICFAALASFTFCLTSYHQFNILFAPSFWFQPLLIVGFIFQFLTFFATFYYGFSKLYTNDVFSSSKDIIKLPDNAVVKEDLSSPEVSDKVRDSNSVILHRKLERIPRVCSSPDLMALNYNFNDANSPLRGLEEVSPNAAASRKSKSYSGVFSLSCQG